MEPLLFAVVVLVLVLFARVILEKK